MKVVILGQSPAVVTCIEQFRMDNFEADITLVSTDGNLPYDRSLFPQLISREIRENALFCRPEDFYRSMNVEIIRGREMTRINFGRRKVFFADKFQLDYDIVIIADAVVPRWPDKKGIRKPGVFSMARLEHIKNLIKHFPFTETAVIECCGWSGIETALAIKATGKEVILVSPEQTLLPGLDADTQVVLNSLLEKRGIRSFLENRVEDVLGEGEVKAVRLTSGKVLAAEMFIVENIRPDLRFLEGSDIVMADGILVTGNMQTNISSAYAIDVVAELHEPRILGSYSLSPAISAKQAETAVAFIKNTPLPFCFEKESDRSHLERMFSAEELSSVVSPADKPQEDLALQQNGG